MSITNGPNLGLLLNANTGEAHDVALRALLRGLDVLVMPVVKGVGTNTPPGSPANGDAYVVGTSPTGVWASKNNQIAVWDGTAWVFYVPKAGWIVRNTSASNAPTIYTGSAWTKDLALGGNLYMPGDLTIAHPSAISRIFLSSIAGQASVLYGSVGGVLRGAVGFNDSFTSIESWDNAGTWLDTPMSISNSLNGNITFASNRTVFMGGVSFGATTLKNYQEGTWTPGFSGLTITGSPIYTGSYTRVGRFVFWKAKINANGGTTASAVGSTTITNLPFVAAADGDGHLVVSDSGAATFGNGVVGSGSTVAYLPSWSSRSANINISGVMSL